jgi:hypothetical protein
MNKKGYTILSVKLQPGAKKDEFCEWMADGTLKIRVKSKPVEGKANQNLLKFLGDQLKVSVNDIEIKTGGKSRKKLLKIYGLEQNQVEEKINALLA